MSKVSLWVHAVWTTKKRQKFLTKDLREILFPHITENAKLKGIYIDSINGYLDHVHCLFLLNTDFSVAHVLQLLKGESSFWINKNKFTRQKFKWGKEFYAASVSRTHVARVRWYIQNQEAHHRKASFREEYISFLESEK